jgi:hypothetical protein
MVDVGDKRSRHAPLAATQISSPATCVEIFVRAPGLPKADIGAATAHRRQ